MKGKIVFAVLVMLAFFFAAGVAAAASNNEAIYACFAQLYEKYGSVESIKKQFPGDEVKWEEKIEISPHDENLELKFVNMFHPVMEIHTMSYTWEGEDKFFIISLRVEEPLFIDFLGIKKGSSREDVIKAFGEPDRIEGSTLVYQDDESGYVVITFELDEQNKVWRMRFDNEID